MLCLSFGLDVTALSAEACLGISSRVVRGGLGFSALRLRWVRCPSCSSVGVFGLLWWVQLLQRWVRVTSKGVEGRAGVEVSFGFL